MIRDQYQGGSTVMTAISGVEIALWDLIGKACGQPVYRLLGRPVPRAHPRLCQRLVWRGPHAGRICRAALGPPSRRGYRALKFDPFGTAWKDARPGGGRGGRRHRRGGARGGRARQSA